MADFPCSWHVSHGRAADAIELNVGDRYGITSHVIVLAGAPDSERIIYDPTFGCYSGTADETPVSIHSVIDCLRDGPRSCDGSSRASENVRIFSDAIRTVLSR